MIMKEELKFVLIKLGVVYALLVVGTDKQLRLFVISLEITLVLKDNLLIHCNNIIFIVNINYGTVGALGFTQSSGPVLLGYFSCNGNEVNLLGCTPNYYNTYWNCQNRHYYDAAVTCESKFNYSYMYQCDSYCQ